MTGKPEITGLLRVCRQTTQDMESEFQAQLKRDHAWRAITAQTDAE
jgi:hypothetical protein